MGRDAGPFFWRPGQILWVDIEIVEELKTVSCAGGMNDHFGNDGLKKLFLLQRVHILELAYPCLDKPLKHHPLEVFPKPGLFGKFPSYHFFGFDDLLFSSKSQISIRLRHIDAIPPTSFRRPRQIA